MLSDSLPYGLMPHKAILPPPRRKIYTPLSLAAFYLVGTFAALPVFQVPLVGLSITAPLFVLVVVAVILHPPNLLRFRHGIWVFLAAAIWVSLFLSFLINGLVLHGDENQILSVLTVVRYGYWLLLFVVSGYFAASEKLLRRLSTVLALAITALSGLRWFEAIAWGKIGAWTDPVFLTQNDYGGLFSTFSPFLFALLVGQGGIRSMLTGGGLLVVWGAAAVNGSRGSWIGMGVGLVVFVALYCVTNPRRAWRLLVPLLLAASLLTGLGLTSLRVREAVVSRFSTMGQLSDDKSYMIRQVMNQKSWVMFKQSPLFGAGPGRYRVTSVPLNLPELFNRNAEDDLQRRSAHNSYLLFLAENGLAATIPYALLLALLIIKGLWATLELGRQHQVVALAVYAGFLGMSVHFWAMSALTNTAAWLIYGLVVAVILLAGDFRRARFRHFRPKFLPRGAYPVAQQALTSSTSAAKA
jgi:O-antigen ligase